MDREDEPQLSQPPRPPGEGIRIIGAEEAAAAIESGEAEGRLPGDQPRFGGPPPPAPASESRPAMRFPLDEQESERLTNPLPDEPEGGALPGRPWSAGRIASGTARTESGPMYPAVGSEASAGGLESEPSDAEERVGAVQPELPHWTEPATGEVPRILGGDEPDSGDEEESWASFTRAPRWRDQGVDWDEEEFGDVSALADEESRLGALDTSRTEHSDLFSFDEPEQPSPPSPPARIPGRPIPVPEAGGEHRSGRDNGVAVFIGVGMGLLFLLFAKAGPTWLMVYASIFVLLCAAEVFAILRRAGYRPATLLGLVATLSLLIGAYQKGERALPLVMVLTVIFSLLWYLSGVMAGRPTVSVAVTIMGFAWAGFLGSYVALILRPGAWPGAPRDGVALFFGAVLCTVTNDVAAYAFGKAFGRTRLAPRISPNKTLEGLLGATLLTVLVGAVLVSRVHPFRVSTGFWLGVAVSIAAPLGDLCESMIKRDIGVKDMGSLLPGHGGVMDRFDAMLFVLPTAYYLAQYLRLGH